MNPLLALAAFSLAVSFPAGTGEADPETVEAYHCAGEIWLDTAECSWMYPHETFDTARVWLGMRCIEKVPVPCYVGSYTGRLTDGTITFWVTCGVPLVHPCGFGFAPGDGIPRAHWEASCLFEGTGTYSCRWEFE